MAETDEKKAWLSSFRKKKEEDQLADLRSVKSEVAPSSLEARERRTSQLAGPQLDGRRLRATGRTEQLNVKVRPEFKKRLEQLAKEKKSSMVEIIEWAVEYYEDDIRARGGRD